MNRREDPLRNMLAGVGRHLWIFRATTCWVVIGFVLIAHDFPRSTVLGVRAGLLIAVVLWAELIVFSLIRWDPDIEETLAWLLPRGDVLRWREWRVVTVERIEGYRVARDLGVVVPVGNESFARSAPFRRMPDCALEETEACVRLDAVQDRAGTLRAILERAEAYAPVVGSRPDWTRIERHQPDRVAVTWWKREPIDPLQKVQAYEEHWATGRNPAFWSPFEPVPIGVLEDQEPFRLQVFGRQTLLVGESGAGKASVLWSIMLGLSPWIAERTVKVYGIDLKGGVELAQGAALFHRIAYSHEAALQLLAEVSEELDGRLESLRVSGQRKWETPTVEAPLILLIIDEAGSLTYQAPTSKAAAEAEALLKRIASTGRSPGVSVIAALQDPRKQSLGARDMFTASIALRLSKAEVEMALSPWAYDEGALADRISVHQPGTGYLVNSETQEIERFRAFWVSDKLIRATAEAVSKQRVDDGGS